MRAFILAGGFATRLWPLTEARAKPLLPLAGKPLLTAIVEGLPADMQVAVSTNAAFEAPFRAWADGMKRPGLEVIAETTRSDDEKLGALGAVAQWLEQTGMSEDVLVLTGDNVFGFRMSDFLAAYDGEHPLVAAYDIGDRTKASAFGTIVLAPDGAIAAFEEKPKEPKSSLVSTGCAVIPARDLAVVREHARTKPDNLGGLFEELLARGREVRCFVFSEPWFDVGSFEAYLEATRALVGERLLQGEGSQVEGLHCEGSVVLGKNCRVRNCRLTDTVVFDGCTLDDCVLERCVIDDRCTLTHVDLRGKMIRAGTVLAIP